MMNVAFTGRADGMTKEQREAVRELLVALTRWSAVTGCHNGGYGADMEFGDICADLQLSMHKTDASLNPMPRNRELVNWCDILVGCPPTDTLLKKGSGTWETIKYGWKYGKIVFIALSDGSMVQTKDEVT